MVDLELECGDCVEIVMLAHARALWRCQRTTPLWDTSLIALRSRCLAVRTPNEHSRVGHAGCSRQQYSFNDTPRGSLGHATLLQQSVCHGLSQRRTLAGKPSSQPEPEPKPSRWQQLKTNFREYGESHLHQCHTRPRRATPTRPPTHHHPSCQPP